MSITGWQEAAHKDFEQAYGVLQSHWCLLTCPIELWDSINMQQMETTMIILHNIMKRHLKSRNPALNVPRRHESVATDTILSDTPAVDSGVKQAQVFVGRDTLVADVYPMKSGKQFVNTVEDNIRRWGAMDKLLSDSAKTEISKKVMDFCISHLQLAF